MSCASSFWEKLDAVCVINLDYRTDRWEKINSYLSRHMPAEKIHRVSAVYGRELPGYGTHVLFRNTTEQEAHFWAGRGGCLLSHQKALRLAQEKGWERTLILEDDAQFLDPLEGDIAQLLARVIDEQAAFDLMFLGMTPYYDKGVLLDRQMTPQGEIQVGRIMGPLCMHCYIVHGHAIPGILECQPNEARVWDWMACHLSWDSWIANEYGRTAKHIIYGCYPNLCVQAEFYSDIEHCMIKHDQGALGDTPHPVTWIPEKDFLRIFGSPKFLFKKYLKLFAHWVIGQFYYLVGYRMFHVSIESAGYFGALKAAVSELRTRKHKH